MLLAAVAGWRGLRELVPAGADVLPWTFARSPGPTIASPDGRRVLHVYLNDAGAAHSGNHWVWIVEHRWWRGWVVVLQGYGDSDWRSSTLTRWTSNIELEALFQNSSLDGTSRWYLEGR